ncbi:hypothetical protein Tco_1329075 [Tanacetum coccineum]
MSEMVIIPQSITEPNNDIVVQRDYQLFIKNYSSNQLDYNAQMVNYEADGARNSDTDSDALIVENVQACYQVVVEEKEHGVECLIRMIITSSTLMPQNYSSEAIIKIQKMKNMLWFDLTRLSTEEEITHEEFIDTCANNDGDERRQPALRRLALNDVVNSLKKGRLGDQTKNLVTM